MNLCRRIVLRPASCLLFAPILIVLTVGARATYGFPADGDRDLRYDADGFGRATVDFDVDFFDDGSVACGPDGSCYLASTSQIAGDFDFRLRRFSPSGAYVTQGSADFHLGGTFDDVSFAVAVQPDGKVVVVGGAYDGTADVTRIAIARFAPGPATLPLDTTFSGDGRADVNFNGGANSLALAIAPDGKIVLAGCYFAGAGTDIAVIRLDAAGTPDPTFDGNGVVTFPVNAGGGNNDCAHAVAVQADGKIVVAGFADTSFTASEAVVVRFTAAGAPDTTFAGDGLATIVFNPTFGDFNSAESIAIDRRGRILIGGYIDDGSSAYTTVVARLTPAGTADSFGIGGGFVGAINSGNIRSLAVAPPPSNRIYYLTVGPTSRLGALTAGGAIDTSFSGDGFVPFDDPVGTMEAPRRMTLLGGMPVVAGISVFGATEYQVVGRYFTQVIFGDDFEGGGTAAWSGW